MKVRIDHDGGDEDDSLAIDFDSEKLCTLVEDGSIGCMISLNWWINNPNSPRNMRMYPVLCYYSTNMFYMDGV